MPAASRTPKRAPRPQNFGNVGVEGRRTGATLKDTGIRDEHGLEPVPTFSSPAKSPVKQNGVPNGSLGDETMDIGESTIPEPTEVRRLRTSNVKFPLPQATTPRRTNIGSSPRRSVGPIPSSAQREEAQTPTRASSHPASGSKRKLLDFSMAETRTSGDRTPQSSSSSLKRPKTSRLSGGRNNLRRKSADLSVPNGDELDESIGDVNGDVTTNGYVEEDTAMDSVEDNTMQNMPNDEEVEMDDGVVGGMDESLPVQDPPADPNPPKKPGRGRPLKNRPSDASVLSLSTAPTRGRPPTVHRDADTEQAESSGTTTQKGKRGKKDKALRDVSAARGPNAQIRPASKSRGKASRSASRVSLSRFVQRSETPGNGEGALITRSGRHSIHPLAHWRGEKAIFEPGHIDQTGLTLGGIKEIIRTDEIMEDRPRKSAYRRPRPRAKAQKLEDVEEDDEDKEPWEVETGVINARVMAWDSGANHYIEEETEEKEIAYAANAIEMRDISGAEFRFAKTLTLPFFGSGMVDLPPGGAKRSKNSRKMQMVFFVFYGRVQVEVGTPTTRFGIGKGGMWQVPRGNFYSISNPGKTPARIFFAQGNEVVVGGGAGGDVSS
ncbi:MAG: hypothetical protein HETSPECPRED_008670 [Heterodermia speciosa]|uniref:CENP-C homolog n=1 Tax=Heterodermia speciosa TaxID=116794 RepID=A0A8H3IYU0_9LECA|nr:MAG: hypothetical protein HETSPECPRED_008670 [Heterodermia speciosa]